MFVGNLMESFEIVSFACSGDHLSLKDLLVEVKINFLGKRTDISNVDTIFMQNVFNALAVN
jgi:hypothetical protein